MNERRFDADPAFPDALSGASKDRCDRRQALRRLAAGALLPLAATPLATVAQDVPVYPPPSGWINPFPLGCNGRAADGVAQGVTFPFTDPLNDLKSVFDFGLNLIPGVGGALAVVFDLMFPSLAGPNLWDEIKDRINQLIEHAIEESVIAAMQIALRGSDAPSASPGGLQAVLATFARDISNYKPGDTLLDGEAVDIRNLFIDQVGLFQPAGWEQQTLPLFAQFANLHLLFLREVIRHGAGYGVKADTIQALQGDIDGYTDAQGVHHDGYLKQYCNYVDATLPEVKAKLEQDYQATRSIDWYAGTHLEVVASADASAYSEDLQGYVATGTWGARKKQNAMLTLLTHSVQDYRDLWPTMMNPGGSGVSLTREVYLGPFGTPDLRDIGITLQGDADNGWSFNGTPDVPSPSPATGAPLNFIAVPCTNENASGRNWAFPNDVVVNRSIPGTFGISLAAQWGGPVVGVKVDIGRYVSRTSDPFSSMPCAAGYLVGEIYFTQHDGGVHVVGGDDRVYKEMKSFVGETLDVPDGHMLSGATVTSTVRQLYDNVGAGGKASIGSLIFGFKLMHPDLPVSTSPSLLRSLYVTNAETTFDGLVQIARDDAAGRGSAFDAVDAAALLAMLAEYAERNEWDVERAVFGANLERMARQQAGPRSMA